jgi:nitrogen fixation protein NifQ
MKELDQMKSEILAILQDNANGVHAKETLAPWIAHNAMKMNHLYEDLGLASRNDMAIFMHENFTTLSAQKPSNVRWKKFLFDLIGSVAPACAKCGDISSCHHCEVAL